MGIDGVSEGSNFSEAHRTLSALSLHCFSGAVRVSAAAADDPGAGEPVRRRSHRRLCLHYPDLPGVSGSRSGVHSCGGQQIGWKNRDSFKPEQSFIGGQQRQLGQRALYAVLLRHRQPVSHRGENQRWRRTGEPA